MKYADSRWLVSTNISLSRRSDNGKINSSPVSKSPAIVRFQHGCQRSLRVPVEDPDGDVVKCRWATSAESSIPGDSCPYTVLNEVKFSLCFVVVQVVCLFLFFYLNILQLLERVKPKPLKGKKKHFNK